MPLEIADWTRFPASESSAVAGLSAPASVVLKAVTTAGVATSFKVGAIVRGIAATDGLPGVVPNGEFPPVVGGKPEGATVTV